MAEDVADAPPGLDLRVLRPRRGEVAKKLAEPFDPDSIRLEDSFDPDEDEESS